MKLLFSTEIPTEKTKETVDIEKSEFEDLNSSKTNRILENWYGQSNAVRNKIGDFPIDSYSADKRLLVETLMSENPNCSKWLLWV